MFVLCLSLLALRWGRRSNGEGLRLEERLTGNELIEFLTLGWGRRFDSEGLRLEEASLKVVFILFALGWGRRSNGEGLCLEERFTGDELVDFLTLGRGRRSNSEGLRLEEAGLEVVASDEVLLSCTK